MHDGIARFGEVWSEIMDFSRAKARGLNQSSRKSLIDRNIDVKSA